MSASLRSPARELDADTWQDSTVQACAEMVSTGPFGSLLHKSDYIEGGVPVINPVNLVEGEIRCDSRVTVAPEKARELSAYRVRSGDILVGRRGDIGRCAVVHVSSNGWLCGTGCFFIRPSANTEPRFLALLLGSPEYQEKLRAASTGATMLNLSNKVLSKLAIRMPSLEEQKRIVAILDQAFAALDRARALAEANLADAQELFEASVERLLGCGRQGWKIGRFQDLVGEVSTGPFGSLLHKSDYIEGGTPVINPSNVVDGNIEPDWTKSVSSEAATRLDSYTLRTGDLIIGRRGEMGRCAPVLPHMEGWLCGTGSFIIRPKSGVSSEFVGYLMRTPAVVAALTSIATGATMLNLSNRAIAGMTIELPKHDEQLALLEAIRSLEGKVKLLRSEVEAKLNDLANLRQSLLQKAFSGQLT